MITLYNVISHDGFIAAQGGTEDFIPDELWDIFIELCGHYDAVVFGRKTYEAVQQYDAAALVQFENLMVPKFVVSGSPEFQPKAGYTKIDSPEAIAQLDKNILVSSGPTLNDAIFEKHLATKIILVTIPTTIGSGIPPFTRAPAMKLVVEKQLPFGVWREYAIEN